MARPWIWLWLSLAALAYGGWQLWSTRAVRQPPGIVAGDAPVQSPLADSTAPSFHKADAHITAVARFSLRARVLRVENYRHDRMAALVPVDVAFGWGPMSDNGVLSKLSFSQGNRFYFWTTPDLPLPRAVIESHSANMHLIPADQSVEKRIKAARTGQVVSLSGYLVNVRANDGFTLDSSLIRTDTGPGSCEVIWVEEFD